MPHRRDYRTWNKEPAPVSAGGRSVGRPSGAHPANFPPYWGQHQGGSIEADSELPPSCLIFLTANVAAGLLDRDTIQRPQAYTNFSCRMILQAEDSRCEFPSALGYSGAAPFRVSAASR